MPIENINFSGINRAITDYATTGACEELINLRPTTGGLVPVKDFAEQMTNISVNKVVLHRLSTGAINYFSLVKGTNCVTLNRIGPNGTYISTVYTFEKLESNARQTINVDALLSSIYFASAGNVILFSVCDRTNSIFENVSYIWSGLAYNEMEADAPEVDFSISETNQMMYAESDTHFQTDSPAEFAERVNGGLNEIQENYPELCFGPIIIAIAYRTKDGKTFWTGNWRIYDPIPYIDANSELHITANTQDKQITVLGHSFNYVASIYSTYFTKYSDGYFIDAPGTASNPGFVTITAGMKVNLLFQALGQGEWDENSSVIQSVEIYSSRPVLYTDTDYFTDGFREVFKENEQQVLLAFASSVVPKTEYNKMDLGDQLLYHQASIQMSSLQSGAQTVQLRFGGNMQVTEETLETDAGRVMRFGKLLSYNARFHYYDSVSHIKVGVPTFTVKRIGNLGTAKILVRYADEDQSEMLYVGDTSTDSFYYDYDAYVVIAPSINTKEVITCVQRGTGNWYIRRYRMSESSRYNFSICTEGSYSHQDGGSLPSDLNAAISAGIKGLDSEDLGAINVSEQYNPYVFMVEHSYLAPGRVLDIRPQMAYEKDNSYGEYPLNVFTDRGLYALLQGSANVLYGAFKPLSNLVSSSNSIPTEMGTFFLAAGSLWLVSGLHITLISDALSLGPHKFIRDCTGFKAISQDTNGNSYNVTSYQSAVSFETFSKNAVLSYNRFRDEIIISNPSYEYSYVLSIKYRQWFKIDKRIWQDSEGSDIANTPGNLTGALTVLKFEEELDTRAIQPSPSAATVYAPLVLVHLQSRPFSVGYSYSHIHRIVSMVRANIPSTGKLVVALYGSDDLQNWNLLSYALRKGSKPDLTTEIPLKVSQIRTATAARSWRYYTICIGGSVPTDTDFGPVLFDYQPVERRFG